MHKSQHTVEGKYRHIYEHKMHSNYVLSTKNSTGPDLSTQIFMRNSHTSHALIFISEKSHTVMRKELLDPSAYLLHPFYRFTVSRGTDRRTEHCLHQWSPTRSYPSTSVTLQDVGSVRPAHHPQHIEEVSDCIGFPVPSLPQVQDVLCRTLLACKVIQVPVHI